MRIVVNDIVSTGGAIFILNSLYKYCNISEEAKTRMDFY